MPSINGETEDSNDPGGVSNRRLGGALRAHVPDLGLPKQISVKGKRVRGWRGWQLLDEAPEPEVKTNLPVAHLNLTTEEEDAVEGYIRWYHAVNVKRRLGADAARSV